MAPGAGSTEMAASRGNSSMKTIIVVVAIIVGLALLGLAALYWLTPAGDLPAFIPGFVPGSTKPHFNHGLCALIIGLAALVFAWLVNKAR
jgi:hypothetical protein